MAPSDNEKVMIGMAFIVGAFLFMNMSGKETVKVVVQHDPPSWGGGGVGGRAMETEPTYESPDLGDNDFVALFRPKAKKGHTPGYDFSATGVGEGWDYIADMFNKIKRDGDTAVSLMTSEMRGAQTLFITIQHSLMNIAQNIEYFLSEADRYITFLRRQQVHESADVGGIIAVIEHMMDQMREKHRVISNALRQSQLSQQQIDREAQRQSILDAFQQIALVQAQIAFAQRWRQKAVEPHRGGVSVWTEEVVRVRSIRV